jgi:hypothetical protein
MSAFSKKVVKRKRSLQQILQTIPTWECPIRSHYWISLLISVLKKIAWMPIEEQARFADEVCKANANDLDFCKKQVSFIDKSNPGYEEWNSTSIGYNAYLALYGCPETRPFHREVWEDAMPHSQSIYPQSCSASANASTNNLQDVRTII